jgi:hypothetical protein
VLGGLLTSVKRSTPISPDTSRAPGQALLMLQIPRPAQGQDHERRFREVRRRTRPTGVFSDRTSMDRILFAVFNHENRNQGVNTPFLLTQTF